MTGPGFAGYGAGNNPWAAAVTSSSWGNPQQSTSSSLPFITGNSGRIPQQPDDVSSYKHPTYSTYGPQPSQWMQSMQAMQAKRLQGGRKSSKKYKSKRSKKSKKSKRYSRRRK